MIRHLHPLDFVLVGMLVLMAAMASGCSGKSAPTSPGGITHRSITERFAAPKTRGAEPAIVERIVVETTIAQPESPSGMGRLTLPDGTRAEIPGSHTPDAGPSPTDSANGYAALIGWILFALGAASFVGGFFVPWLPKGLGLAGAGVGLLMVLFANAVQKMFDAMPGWALWGLLAVAVAAVVVAMWDNIRNWFKVKSKPKGAAP